MDKKTDITEQIIRITEAKADIRSAIIEQGGGIDESAQIDTYGDKIREVSGSLNSRITVIENKIPAQASSENRLADKEFVNSSISTATATFRGTFDTLEALKATEADKNDYAFWVHKDEAGNTCYDKYTYDGSEWKFEYRLNNSSFTAAQWVAINSGITAEVLAALQAADTANSDAITKEIADRKAADTALQTAIDGKQATLVSGTNIKTVNGNSLLGEGDVTISGGKGKSGTGTNSEVFNVGDDYVPTDANSNQATGMYSHSEGIRTKALGRASHAEGSQNRTGGDEGSHAEGYNNSLYGYNGSNGEGQGFHVEGAHNQVHIGSSNSSGAHVEGYYNKTSILRVIAPYSRGAHIGGHHFKEKTVSDLEDVLRVIGAGTESTPRNAFLITEKDSEAFTYIQNIGGYTGTEDSLSDVQDLATVLNGKAGALVWSATITDGKTMKAAFTFFSTSAPFFNIAELLAELVGSGTQIIADDTEHSALYQMQISKVGTNWLFSVLTPTGMAIGTFEKGVIYNSPPRGAVQLTIEFDKDLY